MRMYSIHFKLWYHLQCAQGSFLSLQIGLYNLYGFVICSVFPLLKYRHLVNKCDNNWTRLRQRFCPHLVIHDLFILGRLRDLVFQLMNSADLDCIYICLFIICLGIISGYLFCVLRGSLCYRIFLRCYIHTRT
jgi:hypothetical protein